jgi:hypothetical protein
MQCPRLRQSSGERIGGKVEHLRGVVIDHGHSRVVFLLPPASGCCLKDEAMAAALADNLMLKLRGPAAIRIQEQKRLSERPRSWDPVDGRPAAKAPPGAPVKWDHRGEMACLSALDKALSSTGPSSTMPAYCRAMGYRSPGK